jgi:hypothetical protein
MGSVLIFLSPLICEAIDTTVVEVPKSMPTKVDVDANDVFDDAGTIEYKDKMFELFIATFILIAKLHNNNQFLHI